MRLGVVFPQTEIEPDPGAIGSYVEAVAGLGFDHVLIYDHVVGVDPAFHPRWPAVAHADGATSAKPYDVGDAFHEAMVLLGFLAGICTLELVTGVLVVPQRQTALVAKQAAEVDVLSGGRLRLGVGVGWNRLEFRALGADFRTRGRRLEEQIALLRRFWTEPTVQFVGEREWADGVGIRPLPIQRPIPIWIGAGTSRRGLARVGRLGDGWLPVGVDPRTLSESLDLVRDYAAGAGRDPNTLGIQGRLERAGDGDLDRIAADAEAWRDLGATHVALNTMRCGLAGADAHVAALAAAKAALTHPLDRRSQGSRL